MTLTAPSGEKFTSRGQMKLGARAQDTAMAMTVNGGTGGLGTVEIRLVDRAFYISLGALTQNKFAKIDLTDKSNPIARQYGDILENVDPAREVQPVRRRDHEVRCVGRDRGDRRRQGAAVPVLGRPVEG